MARNGANTPHLNNWMRTFKNIAGGTGRIAVETLKSVTPNISDSVTSATDVIRESRDFITKTRSSLVQQTNALNRTKLGSSAKDIISNAYDDIRSGTFSLDKLNDQSIDSLSDFDIDTSDLNLNDPDSVALYESKKNTAIIGKAVTEGNIATIEGMKQMTNTIASVNVKTSNAAVAKLSNIALLGINQTNSQLAGINNRLDNINANLTAMVSFQNQTTLATNQAALEYYSQSSQLLYEMGKTLAEIKDFNDNQKKLQIENKKSSDNEFDVTTGFNLREYANFIKNNLKNSQLGMIGSAIGMGKTALSMGSSVGMNPLEMVLPMVTSNLIPKNIRTSLERFDKAYLSSIDELLYRIGDLRNSDKLFTSMVGELFGKRRSYMDNINMGNFKKDAMSWNGIAQKTLVEVIPSYLSKIESALTNQEARYYNMDSGKFMTESQIESDLAKQLTSTFEFGMRDFSSKMRESLNAQNVDQNQLRDVQNQLNKLAHDQITGVDERRRVEQNQQLYDLLKSLNMDNNAIRDSMMEWSTNIRDTQKRQQEIINAIGNDDLNRSIYRNLYNTYGKNNEELLRNGSLFSSNMYTDSGRLLSDLTEEELRREERSGQLDNRVKGFFRRIFGGDRQRSSSSTMIDNAANYMYDRAAGIQTRRSNATINDTPQSTEQSVASNRASYNTQSHPSSRVNTQMDTEIQRISSKTLRNVMNSSTSDIEKDSKRINSFVESKLGNDELVSNKADLGLESVNENTNTLKALVLDLHTNFLKPIVGGIFGKDGFFSNLWKNEKLQKNIESLKKKLFDEKDGLFAPVVSSFYDQLDHFKYIITGKGYTNRKGEVFKDDPNSVFGHLKNGYDFVFKNTMKYIFGEDYESNETFNKYFKWMDIKGKKKSKKDAKLDTIKPNESGVNLKKEATITNVSLEKETTTGVDLLKKTPAKINDTLLSASEQVSEKLIESGNAMSDAILGEYSDKESSVKVSKESMNTFSSKFKRILPKALAGGAVGAMVGTSLGIHGTGLIGSLFLPGGPIGGALLGIGASLLSESEGFKKFLFGEKDKDGKRLGGLISNKTQKFFKKNLPLIVGGATVGAISSIFKGAIGATGGPIGLLTSTLLPGGPIGGAIMATGLGLLRNNEKFNKILFGNKEDKDGKRTGGLFSKSMSTFGKVLEKSGNFIKGGLKGLGVGAFTGAALSHAGILGAAVTAGGPIGMGIAGLGLGIASQTKRFQDLLFGTEEFDENGNPKGRMKNGLLHKVRNMLVLNVFEPIKDKIEEKTTDFAFWAKDKIMYPFRLAFGPIIDSLKGIQKNISEAVHDAFNNVAKTVGDAMKAGVKKIFSPFTKLLGGVGKILLSTISAGAKLALTPITAPLKIMQIATMGKRLPEYMKQNKVLFQNFGDIMQGVRETWETEDAKEKYGTGIMGNIRKQIGHYRDMKEGIDTARIAYDDVMSEQGFNTFNWRNVRREKRGDKVVKKDIKKDRKRWNKIDDLRRQIAKESGNGEVRLSDEKFKSYRKKFAKLGISNDKLNTQEDLNMLVYNRDDWKDKFESDNTSLAGIARNGIKMQETKEQREARIGTKAFQDELLEKFAPISKVFTKLATQEALKKRNRLSIKDIRSINNQLKKNGLSWDELGIEPGDLVDINQISDEDWDAFLSDNEVSNKRKKKFRGFNDMFRKTYLEIDEEKTSNEESTQEESTEKMMNYRGRRMKQGDIAEFMKLKMKNISESLDEFLKRKGYDEQRQEAQLEALEDIRESSAATERYEAVQLGDDTGASRSNVQEISGRRYKSKVFNFISGLNRKRKRNATEDVESEKARGLAGKTGEHEKEEAKIEGVEKKNKSDGIGSKIKSTIGSMLGTVGAFFSNSGIWAKLGIGLLAAGLFGDKIEKIGSAAINIGKEYVIPFFKDTVLPFLSKTIKTGWDWFSENLPKILSTVTSTITNNMGTIVDNALTITGSLFTVVGTALGELGKRAANWIAEKAIPVDWVPFPEVQNTKTYSTTEEAQKVADITGDPVHTNSDGSATIMTDDNYVDSEGNAATVTHSGLTRSLVRAPIDYAMHKGTRTVVNKAAKLGIKTAGMITGITPVGKLVVGTAKLAGKTVKAGANVTKKIGSAIINKSASEAVSETAENAIENGAKEAAKKVGKSAVAEGLEQTSEKGLKKFITETFEKICKYSDKFTQYLPNKLFTKVINNIKDDILTAMATSNSKLIKKLYAYITKKISKQATEDAATLATGGLIQIGFSIYDGISGAFEAASLFEVDESYVTAGMRTVSSIMKILLGLPVITWLDLIAEVYCAFTGNDLKKKMATAFYKLFANDEADAKLDKAQLAMEIEVDNYNKANNTKLSVDAYNELKNKKWYAKAWNAITGKGNEDLSSYAPTQAQINAAYAKKTQSAKSATINANTSVAYGTGPKKSSKSSIGYGFTQSDARWGNYVLGKYPDGSTSTMATGGCGPTALSMAANSLGKLSSPLSVAELATSNGYISDGGANADLFTRGASTLGLSSRTISKSSLAESLGNGNPVVLAGKSSSSQSPYTKAGHVIMASGIDHATGKAVISDPMYPGQREVGVNELASGMTHGWSYTSSTGYGTGPTSPVPGSVPVNPNAKNTDDGKKKSKNAASASSTKKISPNDFAASMSDSALVNNGLKSKEDTTKSTTGGTSTKKDYRYSFLPGNLTPEQSMSLTFAPMWADLSKTSDVTQYMDMKFGTYKRTLLSELQIKRKIAEGLSLNSDGILKFQTPEFYNGLVVGDIRVMAEYDATLQSDPEVSLFGIVFNQFVSSKKYAMDKELTTSMVEPLLEAAQFQELLGGYGTDGTYQFKNGIPFYHLEDERWADIKWRGKTVKTRGSDLASLAMVASLYGDNLIPPHYIYNHWFSKYPNWYNSNGVNEPAVFANGGYNALKSTQVDGKRVNIKKISSIQSIISALKQKKPVYMTGYRYDGSIFGGDKDISELDPDNKDSIGSIVALYANDTNLAINDPAKEISDSTIFNTELLKDTFGKNNERVIKSAYVVTDPDGKGVESPIDISSKNAPKSKYVSIKDAEGLTGKLGAIFSNFLAIGTNLLNSLLTGQYVSIKDDTLADDVEDKEGVTTGLDYTPTEASLENNMKRENDDTKSNNEAIISDTSVSSSNLANASSSEKKTIYKEAIDTIKKSNRPITRRTLEEKVLQLGAKASGVKLSKKDIKYYSTIGRKSGNLPKVIKTKKGSILLKSNTNKTSNNSFIARYAETPTPTTTPKSTMTKVSSTASTLSNSTKKSSTSASMAAVPVGAPVGRGIGYGSGSSDMTLDQVTGSNGLETTFNKFNAIMAASMGAQLGGDYNSELSTYISSKYGKPNASSDEIQSADGSASSSSGYVELTGGSTEEIIWNFFRNLGYSAAATAGILGNLYQESGMNPASIQGNGKGPAAGIAQWENYTTRSGRWLDMSNYAASKGKDWTDLQSQLEFIDKELNGLNYFFSHDVPYGGKIAGSTLSNAGAVPTTFEQWKVSNDVDMATRQFEGAFERAGTPMMNVRLSKANEYFAKFGSSVGSGIGSRKYTKNQATITGYGLETTNPSAVSASSIINRAAMEIGTVETGVNNVKYNTDYYGHEVNGSAYPWCCAFVWWVFKECGASDLFCGGQKIAKCSTVMEYYQRNGQFFTENGQPGDLILFNYGGRISHIGIVVSNNGDGTYDTIEGNTSGSGSQTNGGCVMQKTRSSNIAGFARPAYGGTDVAFNVSGQTGQDTGNASTTNVEPYQNPLEKALGKLQTAVSNSFNKSIGNGPGSWFTKTLNGKITSGYGQRKTSLGSEYHKGIDIGAQKGQPIISPIDGQVVASGNDVAGYGNYAVIKDSSGNNHLFAHMNKPTGYGVGTTISKNSIIGEVGSTGKSTGDHLHYEIRKSGNKYSAIDPTTFKYDDLGKDLNIKTLNSYETTNEAQVGTGTTDIPTQATQQKLDIALNATGVEDKLDTLIEVVKTWVDRDAQRINSMNTISHTTNNTAIAYGEKQKPKKITNTKSSNGQARYANMSLASIHQSIASR